MKKKRQLPVKKTKQRRRSYCCWLIIKRALKNIKNVYSLAIVFYAMCLHDFGLRSFASRGCWLLFVGRASSPLPYILNLINCVLSCSCCWANNNLCYRSLSLKNTIVTFNPILVCLTKVEEIKWFIIKALEICNRAYYIYIDSRVYIRKISLIEQT